MDPNVAVDAPLENRPGVPMERSPAAPEPFAPREIPPQERRVEVLVEPEHDLTPVFGTAAPPHGISGAIRRAAYTFPDYRVRRWLLLLLADRLESQEARIARVMRSPVAWIGGGLVLAAGAASLFARRR